jgi:hypothetical protein
VPVLEKHVYISMTYPVRNRRTGEIDENGHSHKKERTEHPKTHSPPDGTKNTSAGCIGAAGLASIPDRNQ